MVTGPASGSRRLSTRLLMCFCREPASADFPLAEVDYEQDSALDTLRAVFPRIVEEIAGKRVIDFGCVRGYQAVGYALAGAKSVVGVEINAELARVSAARVAEHGLAEKVRIEPELTEAIQGDAIVSLNSFEQVRHDLTALRAAAYSLGVTLEEPFLQLAFLCLPVIPHLKITDHGMVDVDKFEVMP